MDCLNNLIGVNNVCTPQTPLSGLYLNHLAAISIKAVTASAGAEYKTAIDLINTKIDLAKELLRNQITTHFADRVRHTSLVEFDTVGYWEDDLQVIVKEDKLKGINLLIDKSSYLELFVYRFALHLKDAITLNVQVWDLISGTQLDSIAVTTVANTPTYVEVNKTYKTQKQRLNLAFLIDANLSDIYETNLSRGNRNCNDCSDGFVSQNPFAKVRGIEMDSTAVKVNENLISSSSVTGGLSVEYSVKCSIENFICQYKTSIALPMLYMVASLLMEEMQYSDRLNSIVTIRNKTNKELKEDYEFKWREALDNLLKRMVLPKNDICFTCNQKIRKVQAIP